MSVSTIANFTLIRTEFFKLTLIPLAADKSFVSSLSFTAPGLDGHQPAISLSPGWCLESVLVAVEFKGPIVEIALF